MAAGPGIEVQKMWDVTVVDFQEAKILEVQQLDAIGQELFRLVDDLDRRKIILDFSRVQFLASAAIGLVMNLHRKTTAVKGTLVLCGLRKELMKVFEIMKLTKVLQFAANEGDALKVFGYTAAG